MKFKQIPVVFLQKEHKYYNSDTMEELSGITSTLLKRVNPKKYDNVPASVLAQAAEHGSAIHEEIELIDSIGVTPACQEGRNYLKMKEQHGLVAVANEFLVSDLDRYATNIDVVFQDGANVMLADIKTTYKLDIELVSWQLSICAYFFEKNQTQRVSKLFAIYLRDDKAELIEVKRHTDEEIISLMQADQNDEDYTKEIPCEDKIKELISLTKEVKELQSRLDSLKDEVLSSMIDSGDSTIDVGEAKLTIVPIQCREVFDSKKFKAENESMYNQYVKQSTINQSLKITIRNGN